MVKIPTALATREQRKQIIQLVSLAGEEVLKELGLNQTSAQKLIENGCELKSRLIENLASATRELSTKKRFVSERVNSNRKYPVSYNPRRISLTERVVRLSALMPGEIASIPKRLLRERVLPKGAEAWFAIPRWEMFGKTYSEAVQKVFEISGFARGCRPCNCCGEFSEKRLRQHPRSIEMWAKLHKQQKSDVIAVPVQFGLRHRGRSVRRVREVFLANEFGLGAFATGIMLLSDPDRLNSYLDLWIDCAGDEYKAWNRRTWCYAPGWRFLDGQLEFCSGLDNNPRAFYGSATAFLPE